MWYIDENVHQVKKKRQGFMACVQQHEALIVFIMLFFKCIILNLNVMKLKVSASLSIKVVMRVAGMWTGEGFHTADFKHFRFQGG